jgi:SAM-dependent methyltransferase
VTSSAPLPPAEFIRRTGGPWEGTEEVFEGYDSMGAELKDTIVDVLGPEWSFEGRRVLDFGAGAGRLLRHFYPEAEGAEFYGSDLDPEMIGWLRENLCPPIAGGIVNDEAPPLPFPDGHFDLVLAISVFTHITAYWSDWLLEMRRILKPDGLLLATVLGEGMSVFVTPVEWDEDATGMNCVGFSKAWSTPSVLHSRWWLRAHWGRAFDLLEVTSSGFGAPAGFGHGFVLGRPKGVPLTIEDLERDEAGETRYVAARRQSLVQLLTEGKEDRRAWEQIELQLGAQQQSRSWRLTAPVRRLGATLRHRG